MNAEEVHLEVLSRAQVQLYLLRLDLIPEKVTGNKWYKLKYNIRAAREKHKTPLITFGGAFSNHLYAFAIACKAFGLSGVAYVRGDGLDNNNPTLTHLIKSGITLHFVDRTTYRTKHTTEFRRRILKKYPNAWIIPEGGSNHEGFLGCQEILPMELPYDRITVASGTGCTAAGIIKTSSVPVEVYTALKGAFLKQEIENMAGSENQFVFMDKYHFGGFAKTKKVLIDFINSFFNQTGIPLDPIYNGKMMYGILDQVCNNKYPEGYKILAIHTGGLQGILGYNYLHENYPIAIPKEYLNLFQ
jgi:1-aminocyclopropane-1-carboxylate deaminase